MARNSAQVFDVGPLFADLDAIIKDAQSPEMRKKAFVDFTREEIAKADASNAEALGGPVPKTVSVNGVPGAPIESIRLNGSVRAEWRLIEEVIQWIGAELVKISPVLTGEYRSSHVFLVDDVPHDPDGTIPDALEWAFVNRTPYARKIEGDKRRGIKPLSRQAPDGVYQAVAAVAAQRFGNIARISFTYKSPDGGGDRNSRNPAISISYRRGL